MATFFLGVRVRVVATDKKRYRRLVGTEGIVNELRSTTSDTREPVGVVLLDGSGEWWFFTWELEPILPSGHTASTESFQELMDRLNTQRVEKVEEVGA